LPPQSWNDCSIPYTLLSAIFSQRNIIQHFSYAETLKVVFDMWAALEEAATGKWT